MLATTFTAAKMRKMSGIMGNTIRTMMGLLADTTAHTGAAMVDVNDLFQRLTLDTIGQCALAMSVNCQLDREDNFLKMIRAALDRQGHTTLHISCTHKISCYNRLWLIHAQVV